MRSAAGADRQRQSRRQSDAQGTHPWIKKWATRDPKPVGWVKSNIEDTFTYYMLTAAHHKHMNSTNMLERLNIAVAACRVGNKPEEFERRTHIVRIFPNVASCLRPIRAFGVAKHELLQEQSRYLDIDLLAEHKKEALRVAA